jgi:hypothetical protein
MLPRALTFPSSMERAHCLSFVMRDFRVLFFHVLHHLVHPSEVLHASFNLTTIPIRADVLGNNMTDQVVRATERAFVRTTKPLAV